MFIIQVTKTPENLYLMQKKQSTLQFLQAKEGFERVQSGQFAFHCEALTGFPIVRDTFDSFQLCDLNMIAYRKNIPLAFVIQKHSAFADITKSK